MGIYQSHIPLSSEVLTQSSPPEKKFNSQW